MEIFSALLALCAGNSPVPVNSPHKGQWRGALMFSLICVWINGWVNNREAGDLRRNRAHCDVIVMYPARDYKILSIHTVRSINISVMVIGGTLYQIVCERCVQESEILNNIKLYPSLDQQWYCKTISSDGFYIATYIINIMVRSLLDNFVNSWTSRFGNLNIIQASSADLKHSFENHLISSGWGFRIKNELVTRCWRLWLHER